MDDATMRPDPFSPLGGDEKGSASDRPDRGSTDGDIWEPIMPAPGEPPKAPQIRHSKHGTSSCRWVYRDAQGAPLFAVARFDLPNGGKELLPFTFGRRDWQVKTGPNAGERSNRTGWHFKRPTPPVPLYGLDKLAKRPDAPVLVLEGEKTTDAASLLFPDMVCVTSQGGSLAARKTDWNPLSGLPVTIWPDNDLAGINYEADVARLIQDAGAKPVRAVAIPQGWPDGWDLADPLPDGVTTEQLSVMVAEARALDDVKLPAGFVMSSSGLHFIPDNADTDAKSVFVAASFDVIGEANDGAGNAWGLVLRWHDRDGQPHEWSCPKRLVHADGNAIAAELEDAGLTCGTGRPAHEQLKRFIGAVRTSRRLLCVDRPGWHLTATGPVFLLPGGEAFGPGAGNVILQRERVGGGDAFRSAGTLETWQRQVARYAVGNVRVALFISASLTSPLLDVVSEPNGGIHLFGGSQTGKTTALRCSASVWGRADPEGQLHDWRATSNGLEGMASETNDIGLSLDELGQADGREASQSAYMLANGGGKSRATRDGSARQRRVWRGLVLSTGEIPLAVKIAEAGRRPMAGQEVRLVSLRSDAGAGLGVFQNIHGMTNAGTLASHLREATRTHYGTAGRAFLEALVTERANAPEGLAEALKLMRNNFVTSNLPLAADGQVRSVCARFGLIAAAGELARGFGVVPWPEGEATRAAASSFQTWLADREGSGASEDAEIIRQIRSVFEAHGTSRFEEISDDNESRGDIAHEMRTNNRLGFRRRDGDGWQYLVLPEAWRSEVCKGLDHKRAANVLISRKLLTPDADGRPDRKETTRGHGRLRVYVISGAILGAGDE